jgi:type I restriction enzyme, S subunit
MNLVFLVEADRNIAQGMILDKLMTFDILTPSLALQNTIADILSSYDELIENNLRRLAILEEAARLLYEEWFVKFRFPRHKQVSMVESELGMIPQGWEVVSFFEMAEILSGGTPQTTVSEYWNGDIPFYTIRGDKVRFLC